MHYTCSECHRPVGLMADKTGATTRFICPRTGRVADAQIPVRRTIIKRSAVLRRLGFHDVPAE